MKKLFPLIIALASVVIISCNQAPGKSNAMADQSKAFVDKYIQAVCTGDLSAMGDALADNFKGYGPGSKDSSDRAKTLSVWKTNWDSVFTSIKYDRITAQFVSIPDGRAKGDWVLEWGDISGTYKNGMPPVKFAFHGVYKVVNNKIEVSVGYYNVADILAQQGFTFVPPAKKASGM